MTSYQDPAHLRRIRDMTEDHETLHDAEFINSTDDGHYYVVLRTWPHPDIDDAYTVSLRYAYLTKGSGSDGWMENGINMRAAKLIEFCQAVASMFDGVAEEYRGQ
mgnify:CR=1 FL=1